MWPEVEKAKSENRRELHIPGERIAKNGSRIDDSVFQLEVLNLLHISDSPLVEVDGKIANLKNLQNLLLSSNKIAKYPNEVNVLDKLKVLDLSCNQVVSVPGEINNLASLAILNLSNNGLDAFPSISKLSALVVLNLSGNKLTQFPDLRIENSILADIILDYNQIESVPDDVHRISNSLKLLNLEHNQVKTLPKTLASLPKLKDIQLKDNPIADKRLLKLINQCGTKQILDYVKQHGTQNKSEVSVDKRVGLGQGRGKAMQAVSEGSGDSQTSEKVSLLIRKYDDKKSLRILCREPTKVIRPHIVCCLWRDVAFNTESFKAFIQLQTKLHETVCQKRELCTIATHDFDKVVRDPLNTIEYTSGPSKDILVYPLGRLQEMTAAKFFDELKAEAEALRKEKKRNVYSGIHKYLHLLDKLDKFAFVKDASGTTMSLPPLTNSNNTRISTDTKNVLIEVTSSNSLRTCKAALEALFQEVIDRSIGVLDPETSPENNKLVVEQVRIVEEDGTLRSVYPSKVDLNLPKVAVIRD